jgi:hypothetical protein
MNRFIVTTTPIGSKLKSADALEKIKREAVDLLLTEKSEIRSETCWVNDGCSGKPIVWVREVSFDLLHPDSRVDRAAVSSADYNGPVPGFCFRHINCADLLAEVVYLDHPVMQWGFRPLRWHVIYTDGTKESGSCDVIEDSLPELIVEDTYITGEADA